MRIEPATRWWRSGAAVRFGVLAVLVAGLFVAMIFEHPHRATLIHAVGRHHTYAPVLAVFGSALLTTLMVPRTLLAAVGGVLFGFAGGSVYVLVGVTLGALVSYVVGRLLGHEFMTRHLSGRLLAVEQAVAEKGLMAVVISRLIPFVPFCIANYVFGTTRVRMGAFCLGTLLGALPATLAYAALGSATARGDHLVMSISGGIVVALGVGGSIGSYLVWRRRPRKTSAPVPAL